MEIKQVTVKTTLKARNYIRLIAALTGEKQYEVMERLLEKEKERLQKRGF